MAKTHKVRQGDCIASIAYDTGFYPKTLWDHPRNKDLRKQREDEHTLLPGDQVFIPGLRQREETRETGARHHFRRKGVPKQVRVQMMDLDEPRAGLEVEVAVDDGAAQSFTTDAKGWLTVPISPNAKHLNILIDGVLMHTLKLGHTDPIDELSGVQGRLQALDFYSGEIDGKLGPVTVAALQAFQRAGGLKESGEVDDKTRDKLKELVGH